MSACAGDMEEARVGPLPICDTASRGLLILMAQAVPSAEQIPCFDSIPDGWTLLRPAVETGEALITLDGAGIGEVTVELTPSCDPMGERVESETSLPVAAVYEHNAGDTETRQLVFAGGCVTVTAPARLAAAEVTQEVSLVSRNYVREVSGLDL